MKQKSPENHLDASKSDYGQQMVEPFRSQCVRILVLLGVEGPNKEISYFANNTAVLITVAILIPKDNGANQYTIHIRKVEQIHVKKWDTTSHRRTNNLRIKKNGLTRF